ncbi:MAG: thioredoxin family protein [Halothiobacillaceae bacterium]
MLGTGCKKCTNTAEAIEQVARELDQDIEVTKITDPASIMAYQAMSTPAAVLDGQVVHRGTMPDREKIIGWLQSRATATGSCPTRAS